MAPEQLKELEEKAKLWDELSPILKTIHGSKFERPSVTTIENTSNATTHIDLLNEEFNEGFCTCNFKKCECLTQNNN